jgi:hypothetical protein
MGLSTRFFSTCVPRGFAARAPVASVLVACAIAGCGGSASPDARYPAREVGCPVKSYPGQPPAPVDELGVATLDCAPGGATCSRQLLDAVCARGGDVAWGLGDNSLTSGHLTVHAAHTRRVTQGPREAGCAVQVLDEPPTMPTENIGPVVAICDQYDSRDACLRELEDQTCQLGGDVLWQVDGPVPDGNKQRMRGRAAHTRTPRIP